MELPALIFNRISFSGEALADLIFFLVTVFAAATSAILLFHWRKYSLGGPLVALMEVSYLAVCVLLLASAFFSLK